MKIGIFDSGVGGLSVLKEIKEKINFADIIYYGDSFNSPYGSKSIKEIQKLCLKIGEFLIDNRVDVIVIACNTATAAALETLKERFTSVPIIGVVTPGAKMAIKQSKNKKIGVLSTPFTAKSDIYKNVIKNLNSKYEVYQEGCDLLCPMIERGWESNEKNKGLLKSYIDRLPQDIDTLILGCTHYPLIRGEIESLVNKKIVDPAEETAMHVLFELNKLALKTGIKKIRRDKINVDYFITGSLEKFKEVGEKFLGECLVNIYQPLID
ncbi:glutamate racemase [Candidatus Cetobacterium colombiensis]|uniref:Glutamate racemase n=1 Tax=Candidatus Cetobacterium colombiensis TaxID=3073100 RepID=A0ABU4W7Y0_9FUSO|nr:glutamate racemase [Candidatus Cetobacterium colombiensis]MDX8335628.1 glutamate racemase [Candidatus Cetobacterium colombiensis]